MPIYAIPVIDGEIVPGSVDFVADENKAKIVALVADNEAVTFLEKISKPLHNSLSVSFGKSDKQHLLFPKCFIRLSKIDSLMENFTTIELMLTTIENDSNERQYIRSI